MTKIVDLDQYRLSVAEKRAFAPWRQRFGESCKVGTTLPDLSDQTVYHLSVPGEESTTAYYELIMGALGLGLAAKFFYLENEQQMRVVDIHLVLADQVRFDLMRRLQWVSEYPAGHIALLALVMEFDHFKTVLKEQPLRLDTHHPGYEVYESLIPREQASFIRRLLPKALDTFKARIGDA